MSEPTTGRFGLVLDCADGGRRAEFGSAALGFVNFSSAGT
jgi:hypothetical protein